MFDAQVFALLASFVLAIAARYAAGTWAHPAAMFAGAWTVFLAIPTLAIPEMNSFPVGAWLIVASIFAVLLSATLAIRPADVTPRHITSSRGLRFFVLVGSVSAIASALITQRANGISFTGLDAIAYAAIQMTEARYGGEVYTPVISIFLLGLTYGAAVVSPFAAAQKNGLSRLFWIAGPAVGAAAFALMTTARAPFLICAAITLSAWLTVLAITKGGRPKIRFRSLIYLVFGGLAVFFFFSYVAASRLGGWDATSTEYLAKTIAIYAVGSLPAYGTWVEDAPVFPESFGAETIAGISQFLLMDRTLGAARPDFTTIGPDLQTNVYTIFRTLGEDFGLAGGIAAIGVLAVIAASAYRNAVLNGSILASVIVIAWGSFTFFSQTTTMFGFANVCFGFIVAAFMLKLGARLDTAEDPELATSPDGGAIGGRPAAADTSSARSRTSRSRQTPPRHLPDTA